MTGFTIGKLADAAGVSVETVRFYERKGLLRQPAKVEEGSYRHYSDADAKTIRFIKKAQDVGFVLREVKALLALNADQNATCSDVQNLATEKLAEIEEKIADLGRMRASLRQLVRDCEQNKATIACCRVVDCFDTGCC